MSNVWSALIGAVAALLGVTLTELSVTRRQRRAATVDHRRDALQAVQDAALDVRSALNEYGPLSRDASGTPGGAALAEARRHVDDALARLDVMLTRVDDPTVLDTAGAWRDRVWMHSVSSEEVSAFEERELWDAMNRAIREVLVAPEEQA